MYLVKPRIIQGERTESEAMGRPTRTTFSRQQARTAATRKKLLAAAARIFARDGFEAARLEDIAAAAGYTRGAFYANFNDKEDLFFALLEQWVNERMAEVNLLLKKRQGAKGQLRTLRNYYAGSAKDGRIALLSLEFRLYAIRHPAAHARLRMRMRLLRSCGADLLRRITESKGYSLPVSARAATASLSALSNALFLEHLVDADSLTKAYVQRLLGIFFDAVVTTDTAKHP
jgi:AcrR family transcriptional regulator